jgi:hypothetical protein
MARQRTYLEVKKIYPAGRIGGSDGVGKSWFQCRVCNGRGSSRNYDLTLCLGGRIIATHKRPSVRKVSGTLTRLAARHLHPRISTGT